MQFLLLSFLLAGCSLSKIGMNAISRKAERIGLEERLLSAEGQNLRYWVGGEGPPVLLLHGFGGDGLSTWQGQLKAFAADHTVIIPDLLWFGESNSQAAPSLTLQATAQLALLDHLGLDRIDVVGISYGGFVTLRLFQLAPQRLSRIVIVDSPGPLFSEDDALDLAARFNVTDPEELFVPQTPQAVGALIGLAYHDKHQHLPRFLLRDIQRNLFADNHDELRGLLRDLPANRDLFDPASMVLPPQSLVVWGSHDTVFPPEIGARLAMLLDAELVVIDQTAHAPQIERPAPFNDAVLEFLQ